MLSTNRLALSRMTVRLFTEGYIELELRMHSIISGKISGPSSAVFYVEGAGQHSNADIFSVIYIM